MYWRMTDSHTTVTTPSAGSDRRAASHSAAPARSGTTGRSRWMSIASRTRAKRSGSSGQM